MNEHIGRLRSDERGIAMVATMFMVLLLAGLGSSMMFISRTEALSSLNYKTMSQARYAAESGVHAAANYLLNGYTPPSTNATDSMAFYNIGNSPVLYDNAAVVLSSEPSVTAHYPLADVRTGFNNASHGELSAGNGTARYTSSARLLSMRMFKDTITNSWVTIQTWLITGRGSVDGAGAAQVEVSAIVERQEKPVFGYAAFATDPGCGALDLSGNFGTDSYDSRLYGGSGLPTVDQYGGNVGTNGNLTIGGSADVSGSLSTPRAGVGSCSSGSVTALTGSVVKVSEGMTQLPQSIDWPTPPTPSPMPPTTGDDFMRNTGCPGTLSASAAAACLPSADGATITPDGDNPVYLGNVSMGNQAVVHLRKGTYIVNSLVMGAQAELILDSGPVVFQVAGAGVATPFDTGGGSFTNTTYKPANFQIVYGGTGEIHMNGNSAAAGVVYAPNAFVTFNGTGDFYGAMLAKKFKMLGTGTVHYDRALDTAGLTIGNPTMSAFTWRSF